MRVAILHEALRPDPRPDERDALAQAEWVEARLVASGHPVKRIAATLDLRALARELAAARPDVVFNLVEALQGSARLIHVVPTLLESLALPFTGCSSASLLLTSNKLLAKRALARAGLPTPPWVESAAGALAQPGTRRWIQKPVHEDASVGIDDAAVVECSGRELARRLEDRAAARAGERFAELFVEGREWNLSLLAKPDGMEVLPPAEIRFEGFPPGKPRIVGYAAKWEPGSFEWSHTQRSFEVPPGDRELVARLERLALECAALFELRGYARVDFRVDAAGAPWILEVNANPCLAPDAGFVAAAQQANLEPGEIVERILEAARSAHRAA
jgi:D-alanine-D-alanine ligase